MKNGASLHDVDEHLKTLRALGVPYTDELIENAESDARAQATTPGRVDVSGLEERYGESVNARDFDGQAYHITEMDALVAYLQVIGTMVDFDKARDVEAFGEKEESQNPEEVEEAH